jgi:hypothetical protein
MELAAKHLTRCGRIDDLNVDALLVSGLNPSLAARSKRFIALRTALRNPGAAIGYLPFSRVNGSPSTRKVRRPDSDAIPILGAADLYLSSIYRSKM